MDYDPSATTASDGSIGRYYDPGTGQFLTVDPLVDETGQPYAYTDDDPVNAIDPDGLDCGIFSVVCGAYDATAGAVKSAVGSVGTHVEDYGEFYAGLIVIVGADSMATAVFVAGFPEDLAAAPAEVGLFGYVLSAANGLGLYLIYKSLGKTPPKPPKPNLEAPGPLGTQTNGQLTSYVTGWPCGSDQASLS